MKIFLFLAVIVLAFGLASCNHISFNFPLNYLEDLSNAVELNSLMRGSNDYSVLVSETTNYTGGKQLNYDSDSLLILFYGIESGRCFWQKYYSVFTQEPGSDELQLRMTILVPFETEECFQAVRLSDCDAILHSMSVFGDISTLGLSMDDEGQFWPSPVTIFVQGRHSMIQPFAQPYKFLTQPHEFGFRNLYMAGIRGHTSYWTANMESESEFTTLLQLLQENFLLSLRESGINSICRL